MIIIPEERLSLVQIAQYLVGQDPQDEPSEKCSNCLKDLVDLITDQFLAGIIEGESTLEYVKKWSFSSEEANETLVSRDSFKNFYQGTKKSIHEAIGVNKDRVINLSPKGRIKTLYDQNPFWGKFSISIGEDVFRHSDDFHSVVLKGQEFTLTDRQASAIEILYRNYINQTPDVGQAYILEELSDIFRGPPGKSLKDLFKSSLEAKDLFTKGKKKGTYRLNI